MPINNQNSPHEHTPRNEDTGTTVEAPISRRRLGSGTIISAVSIAVVLVLGIVLFTLWQLRPQEERVTVTTAPAPNSYVSQQAFGAAWPLTIKEGYLNCREGRILTLVVPGGGISSPVTVYTLNQTAADYARWSGYSWKRLEGSALVMIDKDTGQSKSLAPLLERGADVCRQTSALSAGNQ